MNNLKGFPSVGSKKNRPNLLYVLPSFPLCFPNFCILSLPYIMFYSLVHFSKITVSPILSFRYCWSRGSLRWRTFVWVLGERCQEVAGVTRGLNNFENIDSVTKLTFLDDAVLYYLRTKFDRQEKMLKSGKFTLVSHLTFEMKHTIVLLLIQQGLVKISLAVKEVWRKISSSCGCARRKGYQSIPG